MFSINVQCYSQNHAFFAPHYAASGATYAVYLNVLTQKDFVAKFHRDNASFIRKTAN